MTTKKAKPTSKTITLRKAKATKQPTPEAAAAAVTPESGSAPTAASEPTPGTASAAQEQPAKAAKAKKAAAPKAKPAKAPGKSVRIYEAALKHPDLTGQQLAELLIAEGLQSTAETIQTISSDFKRSVNFLAAQGLMKSPFKQ
jgi:hypothetical protein